MATVTTLGFNIISRYNGAGARKASADMTTLTARANKAGKAMMVTGKKMTTHFTLPVVAVGLESIKMATNFQSSMKRIQTQAGASASDLKILTKQVLELSSSTQQGPQELADSLYHLKAVGMDNVTAMKALKVSTDLAALGNADLEETTNALAGAWRTGIKGAQSFQQTAATVNATIGAGNMRMEDFVAAIGTGILPSAKTFGLSMGQVGAALALFTDEGVPAQAAATRLRMSISLLGAPSAAAEKQLAKIGLSGLKLADAMRGKDGIIGAIGLLKDHLDKSGLSASKQSMLLSHAFGGGRSSSAILSMINNFDVLEMKQEQVNKSMGKYGPAVVEQRKTAEAQFKLLEGSVQKLMIEIGTKLLPMSIKLVQGIGKGFTAFNGLSSEAKRLVATFILVLAAIGPVVWILGLFIKALILLGKTLMLPVKGIMALYKAFMYVKEGLLLLRIQLTLLIIQEKAVAIWSKVSAAATKVWAAAQWLLNAAMDANPITLVIIAIIAIGVAMVVAYKKSSTFRAIVQGAWTGIKIAAMATWGFLKAVFSGFMTGVDAVGASAVWFYKNALLPSWNGIKAASLAVFTYFLHPLFTGFMAVVNALGATFFWLYKNAIHPMWTAIMFVIKINWWIIRVIFELFSAAIKGIGIIFKWLYDTRIKPIMNSIMNVISKGVSAVKSKWNVFIAILKIAGKQISWLWTTVTNPIVHLIMGGWSWLVGQFKKQVAAWTAVIHLAGAAIKWLWNSAGKPIVNLMIAGIKNLGSWFKNLHTKYVSPVMHAVGSVISSVWKSSISKTFSALKLGVNAVVKAFNAAKNGVKKNWNALKEITKAPVRFFVNTVYNNGLRKAWNATAGSIPGVEKMQAASLPKGFKAGGPIPGSGDGRTDRVPIMAAPGEFMVNARSTKKHRGLLEAINGGQGFALGGIIPNPVKNLVSKAKGALGKGVDWATGFTRSIAGKALSKVFNPIKSLVHSVVNRYPKSGVVGQFVDKFATRGLDKMISFVKGKAIDDSAGKINVGGSGVQRWAPLVKMVLAMQNQPASALNAVLSRIRQESGGNPNAINNWDVNAQRGDPSRGLMQTIGSTFNSYAGPYRGRGIYDPLANIYAGINYARHAYGSRWISVMTRPGGYADGGLIPTQRMDSGGTLPRGLSMVNNTTGAPERLMRDRDGDSASGVHYHIHFDRPIVAGNARVAEDMVVAAMRSAQDKGRIKKGTLNR